MSPTSVSLNVINSSTNAPLSGANVFINGVSVATTNSTGNATFSVSVSAPLLQVTYIGFQPGGQIVDTSVSSTAIQVSLTPTIAPSSIVQLQFIPAIAGVIWQISQGASVIAQGVSISDGTDQSTIAIPNGTYSFTASVDTNATPGYQTIIQSIILNGQATPYTFTLIENTDPDSAQQGNNTGSSTPITTTPSTILSQTTTVPPPGSEYIYPNTDYDKYFTITGVRIYIGKLFIDEVNSIQYALQDNTIPVYGYASRYPDAYGQGRSLVQGQLTLNFVTEGYLYTVMNEYAQYISANSNPPALNISGAQSVEYVLGLMRSRDSLIQQAANNPDPTAQNQALSIAAGYQSTITNTTNAMTPQQITSLNNQRQAQQTGSTDVISFDNAVYQDVLFDIRIEMGNATTGVKRVRYIEKCKLISNEQVIAPDGMAILDSYGFIGRRLR